LSVTGYNLSQRPHLAPAVGSAAYRAELMPSLRGFGVKGDGPALLLQAPPFSPPIGLRLSQTLREKITSEALDQAIGKERIRLEEDLGLPFPGMTAWVSQDLSSCECEVQLQDVPTGSLVFPEGCVAVQATVPKTDWVPISGLSNVYWAPSSSQPFDAGQTLPTEQLIAQCVIKLLTKEAHLFIGIQETQWIFDKLNTDYQGLVGEVQKVLPLQRVADVLRRLLEEQVPIRGMRNILESLVYWGPKEKDVLVLTEYVRGDLGRLIAYQATSGSPRLNAFFLDMDIEQQVRQAIKPTPTGNFLALPQEEVAELIDLIQSTSGVEPKPHTALVTSMDIRRYMRRMIQPHLPWLPVYSFQELGSYLELVPMGQVSRR
jgi:type III secretion protein V